MRLARFRKLRAIASLLCSFEHPLTIALRDAKTGAAAGALALGHLKALPPLRRRWVLAAYASLIPPNRPTEGRETS